MKKVIISSNRANLIGFLQNDKEDYSYISTGLCAPGLEEFLQDRKYKRVDISEGLGAIDFRKEYVDFIGRLNRRQDSLYWWATTISCKGTFASNLYRDIFNYYCIISLIQKSNCNYIVLSDNAILNSYIQRYCREDGVMCRSLDSIKRKKRIVHFRRWYMGNIYFLCQGWIRKTLVSVYLGKEIKESIKKGSSYYAIKTWLKTTSFLKGGGYIDSYFGSLPEYLKEKGREFFILAGILTDYRRMILKIKRTREFLVVPLEYFLGYTDYLKAIVLTCANRIRISGPVDFCGLEVLDFLKECLDRDYEFAEINKNILYHYCMNDLLRKIGINTFVYTFENQAWERMSILAIRKCSPSTKIIGYAHSSFRPYLLNYFYSREEKDVIPLPDKVVTVGKEFKDILEESGNYGDKVELSEGCALRYEYILRMGRLSRNIDGNILAALSMDTYYSSRLIRFLYDALDGDRKYKVILRPHPFSPAEMIIEKYNLKLNDNFYISKNTEFEEDLKGSRLVIYINTTFSMEALMRGVPVAYLDLRESLSLDPLFNLNSLKWTVSDKNQLYEILDEIRGMDDKEYERRYNDARSYLTRYFYPVEEKYLERFS